MINKHQLCIYLTLFLGSMAVMLTANAGTNAAETYADTCSVCHGENGAGATWGKTSFNPPPVNFAKVDKFRDLPRERMIHSVTHGRPGTAMTTFASRLDKKEIAAVVDYIRDNFMTGSTSAAADTRPPAITNHSKQNHNASSVGMALLQNTSTQSDTKKQASAATSFDQPISTTLTGDANTGQAYYLMNCTACHGTSGRGDGPRAYFIYPRPRNFLHPASKARFNRPLLFKAIKQGVAGREMPAWGKILNDQQIADITEYVFQTYIHPVASEAK